MAGVSLKVQLVGQYVLEQQVELLLETLAFCRVVAVHVVLNLTAQAVQRATGAPRLNHGHQVGFNRSSPGQTLSKDLLLVSSLDPSGCQLTLGMPLKLLLLELKLPLHFLLAFDLLHLLLLLFFELLLSLQLLLHLLLLEELGSFKRPLLSGLTFLLPFLVGAHLVGVLFNTAVHRLFDGAFDGAGLDQRRFSKGLVELGTFALVDAQVVQARLQWRVLQDGRAGVAQEGGHRVFGGASGAWLAGKTLLARATDRNAARRKLTD